MCIVIMPSSPVIDSMDSNSNDHITHKHTMYKMAMFTIMIILSVVISYADRTNMAITIIPIGDEFKWTERDKGLVLGSFFLGYLMTQVVGGWLSDGNNGGVVLAGGVFAWSLFTLITPFTITKLKIPGAVISRIGLGMAEGVGYPSVHAMLTTRIPMQSMNMMVATVNSMSYVGAVIALLVSAPLAASMGWRFVFWLFGGVGMVWVIPWLVYIYYFDYHLHNEPIHVLAEDRKPMSPGTRRRLLAQKQTPANPDLRDNQNNGPVPKKRLLQDKHVLAMFACYYANTWGFWMIMSWLPTYLKDRFGSDLKDLGWLSLFPYLMQGVVGLAAGALADRVMLKHNNDLSMKRKFRLVAQGVAMIIPGVLLIIMLMVKDLYASVGIMTTAMALNALSSVGVGINHFDLAPEQAGFLYGVMNTIGVVPGLVGVPLTGWIVAGLGSKMGWPIGFAIASLHYIIGYTIWFWFGSFEKIKV